MINLVQLTNQPLGSTGRIMINAIRLSFNDTKTFIDGKPAPLSSWPTGKLEYKNALRFSLFKNAGGKEFFNQITEGETVVFTDFLSPKFIPGAALDKYNFIHLVSDIPGKEVQKNLVKTYSKFGGRLRMIAASRTINEALGIDAEIIYPPFTDEIKPKQESHQSFILGVVSELSKDLGIESVIQAIHRNREMLPQLKLIIIGDGPEKKQMLWLIDHLHLKKTVQLVSTRENCERFIKNFDALVAPNPNPPGWDSYLIQALAYGVPVIASKCGVYQEIIKHGANGLHFEPGNSHILAQHILNLYNNPDWMEHYKKTGPAFVQDRLNLQTFKNKFSQVMD